MELTLSLHVSNFDNHCFLLPLDGSKAIIMNAHNYIKGRCTQCGRLPPGAGEINLECPFVTNSELEDTTKANSAAIEANAAITTAYAQFLLGTTTFQRINFVFLICYT